MILFLLDIQHLNMKLYKKKKQAYTEKKPKIKNIY